MNMTDGSVIAWGTSLNLEHRASVLKNTKLTLLQWVICSNSTRPMLAKLPAAFFAVFTLNSSFLTKKRNADWPCFPSTNDLSVLLSKNTSIRPNTSHDVNTNKQTCMEWNVPPGQTACFCWLMDTSVLAYITLDTGNGKTICKNVWRVGAWDDCRGWRWARDSGAELCSGILMLISLIFSQTSELECGRPFPLNYPQIDAVDCS